MPEPIEIHLTPAELADAARLKVTPEDYLAAKRVQLARTGGLEGDIPRAAYEALDGLTQGGRGAVNVDQWRQATGRDQYGRKDPSQPVRLTGTIDGPQTGDQA